MSEWMIHCEPDSSMICCVFGWPSGSAVRKYGGCQVPSTRTESPLHFSKLNNKRDPVISVKLGSLSSLPSFYSFLLNSHSFFLLNMAAPLRWIGSLCSEKRSVQAYKSTTRRFLVTDNYTLTKTHTFEYSTPFCHFLLKPTERNLFCMLNFTATIQ